MSRLHELVHKEITKEEYKDKLGDYQLRLLHCQAKLKETKRNVIVVVEGPDAAGKGGVIKRLVEKLDPRAVRVWSVIKPTEVEYRYHYMWRFWNKIPGSGEIAIFDRSWYGRVLVERVEGFAKPEEWQRAYREINEFERTLVDSGTIILKFWLMVTPDEQLRRFEKRAADPYKRWKISDEDWRNRNKWDEHIQAAEDMFEETSTVDAPWICLGGDYKWYARTRVLKHVVKRLEKELPIGN